MRITSERKACDKVAERYKVNPETIRKRLRRSQEEKEKAHGHQLLTEKI